MIKYAVVNYKREEKIQKYIVREIHERNEKSSCFLYVRWQYSYCG